MANTKSAIKRIKVAERNRLRNKSYKSAVKTLMKKCLQAAESSSVSADVEAKSAVNEALAAAYSKIDKAVKKGVLHRNNGARKKSRLARAILKANQKTATASS